ncbi:hypothetical protein [Neisseria lactamica]|uniref:hypothetical protein n=1 Tax=Neisseria lactamica TaxID=486 RepID=UPI000E57C3DF|nr:hypothetical protein [Neisseria lactamica]
MSLSTEEKQLYAGFIHSVYNGAVRASADDITPEVAGICDEMLAAITRCSIGMTVPDAIFQTFYAKRPESLGNVLERIGEAAHAAVTQLVEIVLANQRYRRRRRWLWVLPYLCIFKTLFSLI